MMPAINIMRRFASPRGDMWRGFIMGALLLLCGNAGFGQVAPDMDVQFQPRVDWSHVMRMHRMVEDMLDGRDASREPNHVAGATAVRVTLRQLGLTVGTGQWSAPAETLRDAQVIDLAAATRLAAGEAIAQVRARMVAADLKGDLPRVAVGVQVAHTPTPIDLADHAPKDALVRYFAPGYHGLVLQQRLTPDVPIRSAWMWPADAIAKNLPAEKQLLSLVLDLGAQPQIVDRIGRAGGPRLLRFEVIHIVRPSLDDDVVQLVRGSAPIPARSLSTAELDAAATQIALHLAHKQRDDGTMAGTYHPSADTFDPMHASTRAQAVALYAMSRWLRVIGDGPQSEPLKQAVETGTVSLATRLLGPLPREDVPATALTLLAMLEAPHLADQKELRDALAARVISRQINSGAFRSAKAENAAPLHRADQAMILLALTVAYEQTRSEELLVRLRALTAWHNRQKPTGDLVTLSWQIEAQTRLARLVNQPWATDAHVRGLSESLAALVDRQLRAGQAEGPQDVVGGIDLRRDRTLGGYVQPTWGAAFALQFLAVTLRRTDLPDDDALGVPRMQLLLSSGLAARFMSQLTFADSACYYVRSARDAVGGVRRSPADNVLETRVAAHALLAMTQLRVTLDALERQGQ